MKTSMQKIVFAGALLSLSSVAQAGWQHYGGAQCQPLQASDAAHLSTAASGVRNLGNQTIYVTCPVVRQQLFGTNGVQQAYVVVRSNGNNTLSCIFANMNGTNYDYTASGNTTSASSTSLNVKITQSNPSGHYAIYCSLPPNGRITNYWINEYEQ